MVKIALLIILMSIKNKSNTHVTSIEQRGIILNIPHSDYFQSINEIFKNIVKDIKNNLNNRQNLLYSKIVCAFLLYFITAEFFNKIAKKISQSNIYYFVINKKDQDIEKIIKIINSTIDFNFIVNLEQITEDVNFLYDNRYGIYPFILMPLFQNDLKKIMASILKIREKINLLNKSIMNN